MSKEIPVTPATSFRPRSPRPTAVWALAAALLAGFVLSAGAPATRAQETAAAADADAIRAAVGRAVRGGSKAAPVLGVHVVDLESGREMYGHRADDLHIVASNAKLVTTAAALDALGPGHFFETRVLLRGEVIDGVLSGDLAVIGGGDPNISGRHHDGDPYAVFRTWARTLRDRGVRRVAGDLYLDHGLFDDTLVHPDWLDRNRAKWYQAPVSALSFSDNCVLVRIKPSDRVGARPDVELVPSLARFGPRNRASTTASVRRHSAGVRRAEGSDELTVFGSVYRRASPVETWVAVADPVEYFGAAMVDALDEEGIRVDGELKPVPRLPGLLWEGVAVHRSDLLTTIQVTNKRSQNFYAESLIKLLGAERCGHGSWASGLQSAREFLGTVGIDSEEYSLADGSGLSRNNRFSPRQLTRLLVAMNGHRYGREFLRSLPYSGEAELSWRKRLSEPPYRGNVFAKTGTLLGVSTLSGYAKGRSGRVYAFSILCNRTSSAWEARALQDRVVRALIDAG